MDFSVPKKGEAFSGNAPAAKKRVMTALGLSSQREVQYGAAFALALAGEYVRSQTLADDLEIRFKPASIPINAVGGGRLTIPPSHPASNPPASSPRQSS
jgi:hypothetical protein